MAIKLSDIAKKPDMKFDKNDFNAKYQNSKNDRESLNYQSIISSIANFKKTGTKSGSEFNLFDVPGQKYFKLLFYFTNGDSEGNYDLKESGGLLAPTWQINGLVNGDDIKDYKYLYSFNSAWSYLILNDEKERAEQLKNFISLLSNINSESPWYFSELSGLDAALERKSVGSREFKFDEERQKISIKCLPDSFDDRIGTMLDLYRSIVWSNINKREMVPANLRKFDMGIYIFETPTGPVHHYEEFHFLKNKHKYSAIDGGSMHQSSYKYIELHNCEIDYNSSKSAYGTFNNAEGTQMEYTIDIYFDDCYERRFNEFELQNIGDMISMDLKLVYEKENYSKNKELTDKFGDFYEKGPLTSMLDEGKAFLKNKGGSILNRVYLGNLFSFSLSNASDYVKKFADGQLIQTGKVIKNKIRGAQNRRQHHVHDLGNLFKSKTIANNI